MKKNHSWKVQNNFQFSIFNFQKDPQKEIKKLLDILLRNRGFVSKKDQEDFLHSSVDNVTPSSVGIDSTMLKKAIKRIKTAIEKKEEVVVFGDYDVDGIAGTAVLWETLHSLGANVMPYIPSRTEEGYGLSIQGIKNVKLKIKNCSLIITVDSGIVANEAVDFAKKEGIDVIITDHHTKGKVLPKAYSFVHTTKLCGTGVAWMLTKELGSQLLEEHLALVALAIIADLVPITHANRPLLIEGLHMLQTTKRPGIHALCEEAGIDQQKIGVYEIGHMVAPRLNAMGRIASAMDSLRLLCTKDRLKAKVLAEKLGNTNKERQFLTKSLATHAIVAVKDPTKNLLFAAHESYDEGVIGLIAGKLVEEYYRPSIVVSIGKEISKGSARSIKGFNIIECIRSAEHLLINAGGHPMAAGFTIFTQQINVFQEFLETASKKIDDGLLQRTISVDCELPLQYISQQLYDGLQTLSPFGMNNPEPCFVCKDAVVENIRTVGKDKTHLKLELRSKNQEVRIEGIGFGLGERSNDLKIGQTVEIVYTIDENEWNNKKSLQLKIKDIITLSEVEG